LGVGWRGLCGERGVFLGWGVVAVAREGGGAPQKKGSEKEKGRDPGLRRGKKTGRRPSLEDSKGSQI